ncbi:MAG TPA: PaaI family thioesterase [Candidatus Acidoferrales bacterium]|jgi:uncharacterized protein (TIGR00369 family)|nr:PaaI family thioesterase [Candidatus Acidoferrales bacterium]
MSEELAVIDDGRCFACGPDNPVGLHMRFERDGADGARADVVLGDQFQGWRGVAHGGIVMALLDEVMAHAAGFLGYRGVTAGLNARFKKPVPLGEPLTVRARVLWVRRGVLSIEAELQGPGGVLLASGEGKFVVRGTVEPGRLGAQR